METLTELFQNPIISRTTQIVVGILVVLIVRAVIRRALVRSVQDNATRYRAYKATNLFGYLLIVLVVLIAFNDHIGDLGVALGVAGAGIAFALQEVIISIAGWLQIIIGGTVSVGNRVKIGDVKGDIIDIGVLSTTIMEIGDWVNGDLYNGRIISLSNNYVFKEKVHNYSSKFPFLWDEISVPIKTDCDYEYARSTFQSIINDVCGDYAAKSKSEWQNLAKLYRVEKAMVEPMVSLSFDENWITITLRYIVDYKLRRSTKDIIMTRVLESIRASNGKILIASTAMEITSFNVDQPE